MENYKVCLLPLLMTGVLGCAPAPRLRVVQVGGCYDETIAGTTPYSGISKTCFYAVQGWRNTPEQLQQLDSLAAKTILADAQGGSYAGVGIWYLYHSKYINENTKHSIGNNTTMLTQGDEVIVMYSWRQTGEYTRQVQKFPTNDSNQAEPCVKVNLKFTSIIKRNLH